MKIEQAYDQRNLGVTVFRAVFVALLLAGLATVYLLSVSVTSAAYGGVSMLLVVAITLAASLVIYAPANRLLKSAYQVRTRSIFKHQRSEATERNRDERDLLDRLERDLDF